VLEVACSDPTQPCALPYFLGADPPIRPVTTNTFELGTTGGFRHFSFSGSVYLTNVRDEILLLPYGGAPPGGSTINGYFANIDRTRREGIELQLNVNTGWGAMLYGNYSYTSATFEATQTLASPLSDPALGIVNTVKPGNRLPLVPDHQVKGGFALPYKGLTLGGEGRYIGKFYLRGDEANEERPLNGRVVADAHLALERGGWRISLAVTNLFDNHYASFGTFNTDQGNPRGPTFEPFVTPGWVRQFRFTLRRGFGRSEE
jgi:outer membrane receptor protein involved in Fe transport